MNFRVVTFIKLKSDFHLNKCNNILTNSAKNGHKDIINSECLRTITFYLALRWACNKTKVVFGSLCASNYIFLTVCSEAQGADVREMHLISYKQKMQLLADTRECLHFQLLETIHFELQKQQLWMRDDGR